MLFWWFDKVNAPPAFAGGAFTLSTDLASFAGNVVSEDFMKGVWKSVSYWSMIRKAGELVTHPLSAWETSDKNTGPTARHFAWMPAETTCLGRETPYR